MKKSFFVFLLLLTACSFSAPFKKWNRTSSGMYYKIFTTDSKKPKPTYGDHLWMHLRKYGLNKKELFNTMIFDAHSGVDMDFKKPDKSADITEIFLLMGKGDSAVVIVPANIVDSNGSKKKYYTFRLSLIDFKDKEAYKKDKTEKADKQTLTDSIAMAAYLAKSNPNGFIMDSYGNWFFRQSLGSGRKIVVADSVTIHYVGKLISNKQFDNSYDRKQPFTFVVGKKQVIEGLDKGIQNFSFGDKGTLIIPSGSAYGDKEVGKIPPNSILIFELEILQ